MVVEDYRKLREARMTAAAARALIIETDPLLDDLRVQQEAAKRVLRRLEDRAELDDEEDR